MQETCELCPRRCRAARALGARGACGMGSALRVARAALHPFEEPPISGTRGSGTIFFVGCSLGCVFCQNHSIQLESAGYEISTEQLCEVMLALQRAGAHNINLVTPTHYTDTLSKALREVKPRLQIPVVWNSGGYERAEVLATLRGLVDVYLPDFKYFSPALSAAYSGAPDYAAQATAALCEMYDQVGAVRFDDEGLLQRGLMVRHLVLPGSRADSMQVLEHLAALLPVDKIRLSLMRQYTPDFAPPEAPHVLHRRVTTFEYDCVAKKAEALGFLGYFQKKESADAHYTPDFKQHNLLHEVLGLIDA